MVDLLESDIKNRIAEKVQKLSAKQKKKYICEFCGTGFDKRDFLISHQKIRHPEDYDRKYGQSEYASIGLPANFDSAQTNSSAENLPSPPISLTSSIQDGSTYGSPTISPNMLNSMGQQLSSASNALNNLVSSGPVDENFILQLDTIMDKLQKQLGTTMKDLKVNCEMLLKEIRYLICEYRSPFIIFS